MTEQPVDGKQKLNSLSDWSEKSNDARLDCIANYILSSFRVKYESWQKMLFADVNRCIVMDWLNNPQRSTLVITLSSGGLLIAKSGVSDLYAPVHQPLLSELATTQALVATTSAAASVLMDQLALPASSSSFSTLDGVPRGKYVYFTRRQPDTVLTADNFRREVLFGDMPLHSKIETIAVFFDEIIKPLLEDFLRQNRCSDIVPKDLRERIKDIDKSLTEIRGKTNNRTILSLLISPTRIFEVELETRKGVKTVGQKERSMIATKPIKRGDTIFSDHAFVFVCEKPGAQICNNCADTMIVPFPCVGCSGRVVYCSLKCKKDHERVHAYECLLIKTCLNDDMFLCYPLRMLLEGFPEILPYLNKKRDAQSLWSECFENKKMESVKYTQILRSTSCWSISAKARVNLPDCINKAEYLVIYLKNCTKFFESLSDTAASSKEWKIFIGATILRHLGQISLYPQENSTLSSELNRLSPRIGKGQLFIKFINTSPVNIFFPRLFICNHECTPTFEMKYDRSHMKAVAIRDVKVGEEINNSYMGQPRIHLTSKEERQNWLMEHFYFKCQCEECRGSDKNFKEFHQFWCENSNCKKSYSAESEFEMNGGLRCPHCRKQQEFNLETEIELINMMTQNVHGRAALFDRFDKMQRKFKYHNIGKFIIIMCLMERCFKSHFEQDPFTSSEFDKLHKIGMSMLEYPIDRCVKREQVFFLSFFWDVIALRGKKIRVQDLENSLKIVNELEIQGRTVFMNYYEDFIVRLIE